MASSFTPNKHLEQPANNDDINTWDVPVNANSSALDTALGGSATVNVVAATGTVALTLAQYKPPILIFSGLLTADVNYQLPSGVGGFWFAYNLTTGAHTLTVSSAGAGTSVILPQGLSTGTALTCDATNVKIGSSPPFASGTWTPAPSFATPGTSSWSTSVAQGSYIFCAGWVNVDFLLTTTPTIGTGSGALIISGLPYTPANTNAAGDISIMNSSFAGYGTSSISLTCSGTTVRVWATAAAIGTASIGAANMSNAASHTIGGSIGYHVSGY